MTTHCFETVWLGFYVGEPGFEVVGCCGTTGEALEILQTKTVDLVLLDFDLGLQSGLEFMRIAESTVLQGQSSSRYC